MPLSPAVLQGGLLSAAVAGLVPGTPRVAQAIAYGLAYDTYARQAQSCGLVPPSVVDTVGMIDKFKASFEKNPRGYREPADDWAAAFVTYWTGGMFGATGVVTVIPPPDVLAAQLASIWGVGTATKLSAAAVVPTMAVAIHGWTILVTVKDSAVPPPVGCVGPIA